MTRIGRSLFTPPAVTFPTRWLLSMALSGRVTPIVLATVLTMSSVLSEGTSGTGLIRKQFLLLYCSKESIWSLRKRISLSFATRSGGMIPNGNQRGYAMSRLTFHLSSLFVIIICMCCRYLMPACFLTYATTKFEAENSHVVWKKIRLSQLCNTKSFGQTARK